MNWNKLFMLLVTSVFIVVIAGCSELFTTDKDKTKYQSSTALSDVPVRTWEIDYEMSGGFAGIIRELRLSSDGTLIAIDLKKKINITQQVPDSRLTKITDTLTKIDVSRMPEAGSGLSDRCADCFHHVLRIRIDGQRNSMNVNDISLRDSEYAELIGLLSAMLDESLSDITPDH